MYNEKRGNSMIRSILTLAFSGCLPIVGQAAAQDVTCFRTDEQISLRLHPEKFLLSIIRIAVQL
jgi:hypothetical protein